MFRGLLLAGGRQGQNGPLALIFEIFGPETLFGKYIGMYHFLWYLSLVSSSIPFFFSTMAPDVGIWNLKKSLIPELMKLEYCSAMSPHYQHLNHMLPTIPRKEKSKTNPQTRNPQNKPTLSPYHPHPYQNTFKPSHPHTIGGRN